MPPIFFGKRILTGPAFYVMFCAVCAEASAQTDSCSQNITLGNLVVSGNKYSSALRTRADGVTSWKMEMMDELPKILGNADPVHYTQMLPGIQTNGEYRSGVNMQGCENSHNDITIGGVPIYNVNHLLGFFSTFNASHYPTMRIDRSAGSARHANRIGGELRMNPAESVPDSAGGELSVGLISSQGTLRAPLSGRTGLTLSLRGSYMNMLYGRWLNADGTQIKYSFLDGNATITHRVDNCNTLLADIYWGYDDGAFDERRYLAGMEAKWGNGMGALHWLYGSDRLEARSTLYVTSYHNDLHLGMQGMAFGLSSRITDIGFRSMLRSGRMTGGADVALHSIRPQSIEQDGTYNKTAGGQVTDRTVEVSAYADYRLPLATHTEATAGVRGSVYGSGRTGYFLAADPSLALRYDNGRIQVSLSYALRHQYVFQTGFSDIGLPTEFWMSCNRRQRPQYAHSVTAGAACYIARRRYRLSAELFYKRLYNQTEYRGTVLDFVNTEYDIDDMLLSGEGENYGLSLMLNKCSGKLAGWISYTYTHARRRFDVPGSGKEFPAGHERPHELNGVMTYSIGRHWSLGATMVCASGTPFTAPTGLALINGNIINRYGEHNACRLKPYCRLDVSVNYRWKGRGAKEMGVNLSLYNATSHSNELFYYIKTTDWGSFAYRPVSFVLDILPSVNYFCKF